MTDLLKTEVPYKEITPDTEGFMEGRKVFSGRFMEGSVTVSDDSGDIGAYLWGHEVFEVRWRDRRYEVRMADIMLGIVGQVEPEAIKELKEVLK